MNYELIEEERRKSGITIEKFAEIIGMTKAGYDKMLRAKSMKVEILQKIADEFHKPISYFFEMEGANYNQNHNGQGDNNMSLNSCQQLLAEKDKQIQSLEKDKEFLQNLLQKK